MKELICDFHIHTLLSPCGEIEMTPHHIVMRAAEYGIGAIAITDHNASGNIPAALIAGEKYGVKVLPGMEVECAEEAHLVVLFDTLKQMNAWQDIIDKARGGALNIPEKFGAQFVVDAQDNFVKEEKKLLLGPGKISALEVIEKCHALGGICIAAHIDRPSYSLLGQLGFLENGYGLDAAEISPINQKELKEEKLKPLVGGLPYITNSDAHRINDFIEGPKNYLLVEEITVKEIGFALAGQKGRILKPGQFVGKKC